MGGRFFNKIGNRVELFDFKNDGRFNWPQISLQNACTTHLPGAMVGSCIAIIASALIQRNKISYYYIMQFQGFGLA